MCCPSRFSCLALILGIIFGIIIAVLFALGFIPLIRIGILIILVLTVLFLLILIALLALATKDKTPIITKCLCNHGKGLILTAFGTIISAIASLSIILLPIIGVILLIFIGAAFFGVFFFSLLAFLLCVIKKMCKCQLVCEELF